MAGVGQQQIELPPDLETLLIGARQIGLSLAPAQLQQFTWYRDLLLDWNQRVNLTAITDPQDVLTRHFLDSLACLFAIPPAEQKKSLRLLDVGSGAGFPGLPLQIVFPDWRVTLLEATGKKVRFLEAVIASLKLSQARAIQGRAEELAHDQTHRARYDLVTARGLAALPTLLEYCLPFCHPGGLVIAPKKGAISAEVEQGKRAAVLLGGRFVEVRPFSLPGLEDQRALAVFRATRAAPAQYPRRAGAPVKQPLG
ncbi:MAG TPA: 16S rRNA (guanine(527)-N(7))-methyltransferase RsmG [Ktedonobacterales bacterium]|jgi:16S rRNA (guanine527-N7)-methyltransferase